ncbi:pimeloyl-ACP methyl ester carboxylesterase [Kitasatospora sp. MAA4]|uniref:alpha/beta hydrolase n=1 Tax=Kitasatospora sp. MAA4 TaxID=3035093 RepID=UPI0024743257|nr:alpha/beta hydrolase [Kitasatospora sp. MAA4]MDH6135975.1 pimeloyl-ACP methyl ester carboxylesterase [Kitasatospora sp. MAA4]
MTTSWLPRLAVPVTLGSLLLAGCTGGGAGAARSQTPSATSPAAAAASPSGTDPALASFYGQQIAWSPCPDGSTLQCGRLHVPLDYAHPAADALDLALIREPAADPGHKVGSLVVNPGGPGESGVDLVKNAHGDFEGPLHDHYDVVGFDPRGTGASSPIHCLTDQQRDALDQQDPPADPTARKAQSDQRAKDYAAACEAAAGKLLPFVGTRNTARDMDVLRQALGQDRLDYLGISYGTYLGALYAEEFPGRTGRLVLDGAIDPAADKLDSNVQQQIGFEKSFERFAADCVTNHASECPLGSDPATAGKKAADFLDGLREKPVKTGGPRLLTSTLGWTGALLFLYGDEQSSWPQLRHSLAAAMQQGDGSGLLEAADSYNGRDQDGHYNASDDAQVAISCADGASPAPSPARVQQVLAQLKQGAPLLNSDTAAEDLSSASCAGWPFQSTEKPHTIRAEGSAPILVIGTTDDPATPYAAAQNLAKGFANATLLTREGEGHAAFGSGNACVNQALDAYLVNGTMPAPQTSCAP